MICGVIGQYHTECYERDPVLGELVKELQVSGTKCTDHDHHHPVIIIIIITIIIIISHACTAGFGSDTPVEGEQYAHRAHQDDAEDTLQIQR